MIHPIGVMPIYWCTREGMGKEGPDRWPSLKIPILCHDFPMTIPTFANPPEFS